MVKAEISVKVFRHGIIFLLILFLELLSYFRFSFYVFEVTTFLSSLAKKLNKNFVDIYMSKFMAKIKICIRILVSSSKATTYTDRIFNSSCMLLQKVHIVAGYKTLSGYIHKARK